MVTESGTGDRGPGVGQIVPRREPVSSTAAYAGERSSGAQPTIDEPARDRIARRKEPAARRWGLEAREVGLAEARHLFAAEPRGVLELLAIDLDLGRGGTGVEAEHDRARKRPRLRSLIHGLAHDHSRLLAHLARHRFLEALP